MEKNNPRYGLFLSLVAFLLFSTLLIFILDAGNIITFIDFFDTHKELSKTLMVAVPALICIGTFGPIVLVVVAFIFRRKDSSG